MRSPSLELIPGNLGCPTSAQAHLLPSSLFHLCTLSQKIDGTAELTRAVLANWLQMVCSYSAIVAAVRNCCCSCILLTCQQFLCVCGPLTVFRSTLPQGASIDAYAPVQTGSCNSWPAHGKACLSEIACHGFQGLQLLSTPLCCETAGE